MIPATLNKVLMLIARAFVEFPIAHSLIPSFSNFQIIPMIADFLI
jgi:hypothetical protein